MKGAMFRPASTGLDHAWVVARGLTQILVEGFSRLWGQLVSLIKIHGGALLFDVNSLLDCSKASRNCTHSVTNFAPKYVKFTTILLYSWSHEQYIL